MSDSLTYHASLREYQRAGVRFLTERASALLADEMGLGKTVQIAVALSITLRETSVDRALVVVPAPLKLNWLREMDKWAPKLSVRAVNGPPSERAALYNLPFHVLIASYEQVRNDIDVLRRITFGVVVLDEAQRIKNPHSTTAVRTWMLRRRISWVATGTPVENSLEDLQAIFRFVRPGTLGTDPTLEAAHTSMRPYFLRRRQHEVFDELPELIMQDMPLELGGAQREHYRDIWRGRQAALGRPVSEAGTADILALITRLKQACNFDPESGQSVKLDTLIQILQSQTEAEHKVLLFSQYVKTLLWLEDAVSDTIPSLVYHGGQSQSERELTLDRFRRTDGPILLLTSLRAGGVGLNLQETSTVVMFDRWWNPAVENQAIYRAYRFGRTRSLHVFRLFVEDTIEERILAILKRKTHLFTRAVDDAASADVSGLTRHDLIQALGLRQH